MTEMVLGNEYSRPCFTLQWHLTTQCEYSCKNCYMQNSTTFENETNNELDLETCMEIIDDFQNSLKSWGISGRINFTGGDPLLKNGIFELIEYAKSKDIQIGILGNPDKLTEDMAQQLAEYNILSYQISIDGLEKTHDLLRGRKGAFKDSVKAIETLKQFDIPSAVMFTLSKENAHDLVDVIKLCAEMDVYIFDFARLVPIGSGKNSCDQLIQPLEYKTLLLRVLEEYKGLKETGNRILFGRKDPLWNLLYYELGLLKPLPDDKYTIYKGCNVGINLLAILADGSVLPCRRIPIIIGKIPFERIRDIFIYSPILNSMRHVEIMEKCGKCPLIQFCRGCPAVAYGMYGYFGGIDPQCWKEV